MELEDVLPGVQMEVARRFGKSVRWQREGPVLVLVCERNGATLGVTVDDPGRPSFGITYPAFAPDAVSWKDMHERAARDVLLAGVLWILEAVERDGAVLPEFPTAGLQREARRHRPSK